MVVSFVLDFRDFLSKDSRLGLKSALPGDTRRLDAVVDFEFSQDMGEMAFHGGQIHIQGLRDLHICLSLPDQGEHADFRSRQLLEKREQGLALSGKAVELGQYPRGLCGWQARRCWRYLRRQWRSRLPDFPQSLQLMSAGLRR